MSHRVHIKPMHVDFSNLGRQCSPKVNVLFRWQRVNPHVHTCVLAAAARGLNPTCGQLAVPQVPYYCDKSGHM